jgi:ABC-2 type transport system ATP-binding protein
MSEMALVATHLIVIGRGRILADTGMSEFIEGAGRSSVRVRSPEAERLGEILRGTGATVGPVDGGDTIAVSGIPVESVGEAAAANGIVLHELTERRASLEDAFMKLTGEAVEYRGRNAAPSGVPS